MPLPDDDPDGQKLLKSETLLDDALKLWKPLEANQGERVEVWLAGYEIYMRKSELIPPPSYMAVFFFCWFH